jgi:3-hydroxyacyl-[acyl-carrier-protein] dehydratase
MPAESLNFGMTVLIKYCGGCNPWYDRIAFVEQLRQEFPGVEFFYPGKGFTQMDIVLLVCGCPVKCATCDTVYGRLDTLTIASRKDYDTVKQRLGNYR